MKKIVITAKVRFTKKNDPTKTIPMKYKFVTAFVVFYTLYMIAVHPSKVMI